MKRLLSLVAIVAAVVLVRGGPALADSPPAGDANAIHYHVALGDSLAVTSPASSSGRGCAPSCRSGPVHANAFCHGVIAPRVRGGPRVIGDNAGPSMEVDR